MSKLIGKKYPHDIVIDMDKVKEIRPSDNGHELSIVYKDFTSVKVENLKELK